MVEEQADMQAAGDISNLQAAMAVVEQACAALQVTHDRAAAEATLLAFRKSYRPIQACQYILEHSQIANARFQAAAALQESAIREWGTFTADEKSNLRIYCLHYVMARAAAPEAYVQAKVAAVAAALTKRGWLDMVATEKDAFFNEVRQSISGAHGVAAQVAGISFLESLVSEFSPTTASAMGLSTEIHEHCRALLELEYLQKFYCWAFDAAVGVAGKILQGSGSQLEVHVCAAALRLMSHILSWEFQGTLIQGLGGTMLVGKIRANAFSVIRDSSVCKRNEQAGFLQPGRDWQDTLLSPDHTSWILQFYAHLQKCASDNSWIDSPLCVSARQLIVQLSCLTGSIFPSDRGVTQEQHLQQLLCGIMSWISPPESVILAIKSGKSESEFLDGCRALGLMASLTSPSIFDDLLKPVGSTLSLLSSLTGAVIKECQSTIDEEQTWAEEALDGLLDTWTFLLQPADLSRIPLPEGGVEAAAEVFRNFVQVELRSAAASADDEGEETEQLQVAMAARDERLSAFALIARAAPAASVPLLAALLSERCSFISECGGGRSCPTSVLEELHWLLIMSGHVVADPGDGETPMIPDAIHMLTLSSVDHPAVMLSRCAIALAGKSLEPSLRTKVFSSRLMEAIVWFFARWVDTYLFPVDAGRGPNSTPSGHEGDLKLGMSTNGHYNKNNAMVAAFGEEGEGCSILECLIKVAMISLTEWPGEKALQELTCLHLLPALSRRRNVCAHIVKLESWQHFAKTFAYLDQTLLVLPSYFQRGLAEVLCQSSTGMGSAESTNQFVLDLFRPLASKLVDLAGRSDLGVFAQKPDAILLVSCLMERLRGAAKATMSRSQKALFEIGTTVMQPLLRLLEEYRNQSAVVYILLKYVVDWVDGQVAYLEGRETAVLFSFCVQLLQIYSAHNIGKVSVILSKNLLNESQVEKYKDLRALLQLLTNLSSKDLVDFAQGSSAVENPDVAQVVYLGLHIITPLISTDLLKYPKLCQQYFTLLVHMLEVYPDKIAKLPKEEFGQIMSTLEYGLQHQDIEVVNMSLTALNAVAFFHYQALCRNEDGLGLHAKTSDSGGGFQDGVLGHFLRWLLQYLLFEDYSNELIEPAADALLPLILCDTALYQRLAQELVQNQQNIMIQARLAAAFHLLITGNQVTSSLDRANRRRFRANLYNFLSDVRGFLRTK